MEVLALFVLHCRVYETMGIRQRGSFIGRFSEGFDEVFLLLERLLNADKTFHLLLGGGLEEIFGGQDDCIKRVNVFPNPGR